VSGEAGKQKVGGQLLATGVPNLDAVLGGGIRQGAVAMVIGAPGAGKTVLVQQIAFNHARAGAGVLYLTGYSETHDKLIQYDASMGFFDPDLVGEQLQILSLAELMEEGADTTEDAIVEAARVHHASLVVLDGFASMRRLLPTDAAARFVYSLGAKLALLGATTLIAVEGDVDNPAHHGELTVSDVVLALREVRQGTWARRLLHVVKVRGAKPLNGIHPFTISDEGIHIYPRFESVVPVSRASWDAGRVGFGIPDLDERLGGGLTIGTATLVAGSPGTGKTLMGLHLVVEGARVGEAGLFVGFMESAEQLRAKARTFGLDLEQAEAAGLVRLLMFPGYDVNADQVAEELRADVEARGVRRLVVDSSTELERAIFTEERKPNFLAALVNYVRAQRVTAVMMMDVPKIVGPELDLTSSPLAVFAENLLLLRHVELRGEIRMILAVLKMRFSRHDTRITEYTIADDRGIRLVGTAPTVEGLLTGLARSWDGKAPRTVRRPRRAP
jgi:circadian clock protein KaiC